MWELNNNMYARHRGWHIILQKCQFTKDTCPKCIGKTVIASSWVCSHHKDAEFENVISHSILVEDKTLPKIFAKSLAIKSKHATGDPWKHPEWS